MLRWTWSFLAAAALGMGRAMGLVRAPRPEPLVEAWREFYVRTGPAVFGGPR